MYTFNPLSEEELNAFDLMEEGTYDFEVLKATRAKVIGGYVVISRGDVSKFGIRVKSVLNSLLLSNS